MEEDIKILKSYIKAIDTFGTIDYKCINNLYNPVKNILNELERLQKEFKAVDHECSRLERKEIELENKKCLHCGNDTPLYCETCYQELITKNAELQLENEELRKEVNEENKRCMLLTIEKQDLIENSIPKQVIRVKIEELKAKYNLGDDYWQYDYDVDMNTIDILKELLGE